MHPPNVIEHRSDSLDVFAFPVGIFFMLGSYRARVSKAMEIVALGGSHLSITDALA